ncbi:hypothetical protein Tco_1366338, partial [Tanacetum coccineum]
VIEQVAVRSGMDSKVAELKSRRHRAVKVVYGFFSHTDPDAIQDSLTSSQHDPDDVSCISDAVFMH